MPVVIAVVAGGGGGSSSASSSLEKGFRGVPWRITKQEAIAKYGLTGNCPEDPFLRRKGENLSLGSVQLQEIVYVFLGDGTFKNVNLKLSSNYVQQVVTELTKMFGKPTTLTNSVAE